MCNIAKLRRGPQEPKTEEIRSKKKKFRMNEEKVSHKRNFFFSLKEEKQTKKRHYE